MHTEIWSENMRVRSIVRHNNNNNNKTDVTWGGSVNTSSTSSGSGRRPVTTFSEQGIVQLLKTEMESTCSPETSVGFQRITQRYIPGAVHNHNCVNRKSHINQTRFIRSHQIHTESNGRLPTLCYRRQNTKFPRQAT
jgi:hypothetical protein